MIIPIFITLICLSLFFLVYGWHTVNDTYRLIGITLFFLLCISISPWLPHPAGDIEYKSGEIHTTINSTTTITDQYSTYENHTISFYTILLAIMIFSFILFERRQYDDD